MIELYKAATPNGWKISIALEELGLPYQTQVLDLGKLEQKQDWYLKLNPNGRIPTVVDRDAGDYSIADIATWPWVRGCGWSGLSIDGLNALQRWLDAVAQCPGVRRGMLVAPPRDIRQDEAAAVDTGRKFLV
jgi:glutathione S-transferase